MMEQNSTKKIKLAAQLDMNEDAALIQALDAECTEKRCSRSDVIRWAVIDRYGKAKRKNMRRIA